MYLTGYELLIVRPLEGLPFLSVMLYKQIVTYWLALVHQDFIVAYEVVN